MGDLGHCFMVFFNQCITGKDLKKDEVDFNSRPVHSDYGTFMYTTNSNKIIQLQFLKTLQLWSISYSLQA